LGADIDDLPHDDLTAALFGESQSRLIVEVAQADLAKFDAAMGESLHTLGRVVDDHELRFPGLDPISLEALIDAFNRTVVPAPLGGVDQ
jgi:phosphoribosylformylglycinamidine (FGAM) synthase-like enzyme